MLSASPRPKIGVWAHSRVVLARFRAEAPIMGD
jgi:hypothetical protein